MSEFQPCRFESEGSVETVNGKISYHAVCEDVVLNGADGQPEASMFVITYLRTDTAEENRPVLFVWNGGPGSSCVWLHCGMFGPLRMKYADAVHPPVVPPYEMEENSNWLLDAADIVLMDPVGAGYGRLLKKEAAERYYGCDGDARAFAEVIERWLNDHGRRNTPVYLCGESYGTMRAPLVAEQLMDGPFCGDGRLRGIAVAGILSLGTILDVMGNDPLPVSEDPMNLYTEAAAAWYHQPEGKLPLREHLEEAWNFATSDYLTALYRKNALSAEKLAETAARLAALTDVPADEWLRRDLRMSLADFAHDAAGCRGYDIGVYDGRYTMRHLSADKMDPVCDDPAMGAYVPSFLGAMESIMKKRLNITFDRELRGIDFHEVNGAWKYECAVSPRRCLEKTARRNPSFRYFMGAGLYDLCTSPGYARALEAQLEIPRERVCRHEYESGHMSYLGEESLKALT